MLLLSHSQQQRQQLAQQQLKRLMFIRTVEAACRRQIDRPPTGWTELTVGRRTLCGFHAGEAWDAQRAGFVRGTKGAITRKIKHAVKLKTSPARLAQLLHNCCSPH